MELEYYVPEDFASDDSFVNYCFEYEPKDVAFWRQWLADHPERKEIAEHARELVFSTCIKVTPEEKQKEWEKVRTSLEQSPVAKNKPHDRPLRIFSGAGMLAAILLFAVVGVVFLYWGAGESAFEMKYALSSAQLYNTTAGQRRSIILNDGTQVWLNADSRLICSNDFDTGSEREVSLSGEAYFKVAHNPLRPFIIHTQKLNVKVLGTELNIEAYPGERKEVAALIRGSIEVSLRADPKREIILKPNEKITVLNNMLMSQNTFPMKENNLRLKENKFIVAPLSTDPLLDSGTVETAWMEGKLVFRDEPFGNLAGQMERRYNVQVHFTDDSLKNYRFTGIFSTETISEALHALQLTTPSDPFGYRIDGNDVFITQEKRR